MLLHAKQLEHCLANAGQHHQEKEKRTASSADPHWSPTALLLPTLARRHRLLSFPSPWSLCQSLFLVPWPASALVIPKGGGGGYHSGNTAFSPLFQTHEIGEKSRTSQGHWYFLWILPAMQIAHTDQCDFATSERPCF